MVELERPQTTVRRIRFGCWITKATHTTHIFNTYCFPLITILRRKPRVELFHIDGQKDMTVRFEFWTPLDKYRPRTEKDGLLVSFPIHQAPR